MHPGRSESSPGGLSAPAFRSVGSLSAEPAGIHGVYSSAAYAAVAAAAHAGYMPVAVDSVAFYPSLQVMTILT